jgi:hypothetical protein
LDHWSQLLLKYRNTELVQRSLLLVMDQIFQSRRVIAPQEYPDFRDS